MRRHIAQCRKLIASDAGPTAIEYAVLISLGMLICIATVNTLASALRSAFSSANDQIEHAVSSGAAGSSGSIGTSRMRPTRREPPPKR